MLIEPGRIYLAPSDSPYGNTPAPAPVAPPTDPGPGQPAVPAAPAAAKPNGSSEPAPEGSPTPAPTGSVSVEDLQKALDGVVAPLRSQMDELRAENEALRAAQSGPAPAAVPEGEDDFTQDLLTDPKKAVTGVVKGVVADLAPFLNELSGTAHEAILEGHRAAVDAEFGAGTFQTELMPVLQKRFDTARSQNPTLLASREWINSEVNGVKGFKMNTLMELKGKATEARSEAEKAEAERLLSGLNLTNLTGGVRQGSGERTREPTEAEKAYLASCETGGHTTTVENLRKSQDAGTTLAGLSEAFKPEGQ